MISLSLWKKKRSNWRTGKGADLAAPESLFLHPCWITPGKALVLLLRSESQCQVPENDGGKTGRNVYSWSFIQLDKKQKIDLMKWSSIAPEKKGQEAN